MIIKNTQTDFLGNRMKEYALYRGDDLIIWGTIQKISDFTGIKQSSVRFLKTPSYIKRNGTFENRLVLIDLDED